jgi:hypothetical protein
MLIEQKIHPSEFELKEMSEKDPYFYKFVMEYGSSPPVIGKRIIQKLCPKCGGTALKKLWDREPSDGDHLCDAHESFVSGYKCQHCGTKSTTLKTGTIIEEITTPNWRKEIKQNELEEKKIKLQDMQFIIEKKASEVKEKASELQKLKQQLINERNKTL